MIDISVWLAPQKKQAAGLQLVIDNLASKYGAFPFLPHITVYYLADSLALNKAVTKVQTTVKNTAPLTLFLENISYSEQFTKTLFAKYQSSPALLSFYKKLKETLYSLYPYELSPHLSLIYKNKMREEDKLKELSNIKIPKKLILDRLLVVYKEGSIIKEEKDVLDWKIAFEMQL